jgi:predicted amidohydrolase YtcJ
VFPGRWPSGAHEVRLRLRHRLISFLGRTVRLRPLRKNTDKRPPGTASAVLEALLCGPSSLFGRALVFTTLAVTTPSFAQQSTRVAPADIVILHAKVFTLDTTNPWAQGVAIRKGKIVAVGRQEEVERMRGIGTRVIDAGARVVIPGLTDCHVHFYPGSTSLRMPNLEDAKSVADILKILTGYAKENPGNDWIVARGWDYSIFGARSLPDRSDLDGTFLNRPVFLESYDSHAVWVNSKALSIAGITKDTPNPRNGWIVHDPKSGDPTGVLLEDADRLVRKFLPEPREVDKLIALRAGIKLASRYGITRVQSAGEDFPVLSLLQQIREEGQLTVRFQVAYSLPEYQLRPQDLDTLEAARKKFRDDWIEANAVKFNLDGVIEAHTAAMIEPYTDDPSTSGSLFWDVPEYKAAVAELDKRDIQVYTHAIGDLAVRTALDAYEEAAHKNHSKGRRHRVEHIETIAPQDVWRFGKLAVLASMQPLRSYPDEDTLKVWVPAVGPDRASRAWAWNSIGDGGGRYVFGSDWPMASLNPFAGIQTAVTRQTEMGKPPGGFVAKQRLTVGQAVEAYTLGAAFAGHREKTEGSIVVGKVADLIVLDRNIFEVEAHSINKTTVVLTIVGGKIVYEPSAP